MNSNTPTIGTTGHIVSKTLTAPATIYKILDKKRILISEYREQNGVMQPDLSNSAIVHRFTLRVGGEWVRQGHQEKDGDRFIPN